MKNFNIYENKDGEIKAIKQGWSWLAAIFGVFWALYNKMWLVIGVTLGVIILVTVLEITLEFPEHISRGLTYWFNIIVFVIFGIYGNKWKEKNLISRGYVYKDIVEAKTSNDALLKYSNTEMEDNMNESLEEKIIQRDKAEESKYENTSDNLSLQNDKNELEKKEINTIPHNDTSKQFNLIDDRENLEKETENTIDEQLLTVTKNNNSNSIGKYLKELTGIMPFISKLGYKVEEIEIDLKNKNKLIIYINKINEVKSEVQEKILNICQEKKISILFLSALVELSKIQNEIDSKEVYFSKIEVDLEAIPSVKIKFTYNNI